MSGEFSELTFKEKPNISQVFIRQLDRTNQSAALGMDIHQANVYQTLANLPSKWREWVYSNEDRYKISELTLMYKKFAERRIGSKNFPRLKNPKILVNRLEDGSIDWTDPNIVSPLLREYTKIDYQKFNEVVMEAAESAGLTWNIDELEVDAGDTAEQIEKIKRLRTPFIPKQEPENPQEKNNEDST